MKKLADMYPLRYCISCERVCAVLVGDDGTEIHTKMVYLGVDLPELDICEGPFTACTPPENFESDWDLDLVEPSGDEMFIINSNAEQLLADLEG